MGDKGSGQGYAHRPPPASLGEATSYWGADRSRGNGLGQSALEAAALGGKSTAARLMPPDRFRSLYPIVSSNFTAGGAPYGTNQAGIPFPRTRTLNRATSSLRIASTRVLSAPHVWGDGGVREAGERDVVRGRRVDLPGRTAQ
jgi:hypothetical protein